MRPLPDDIRKFVQKRFRPTEVAQVLRLIDDPATSTPRVQRAVLFLSNGSMSLLKHFIDAARTDVRDVLVRAEYLTECSAASTTRVRDLAEPFPRPWRRRPIAASRHAPPHGNDQRSQRGRFHGALANRSFRLGDALYVVSPEQESEREVRCYRQVDNVVSIVKLPAMFVLEQLSEHVDMDSVTDAAY